MPLVLFTHRQKLWHFMKNFLLSRNFFVISTKKMPVRSSKISVRIDILRPKVSNSPPFPSPIKFPHKFLPFLTCCPFFEAGDTFPADLFRLSFSIRVGQKFRGKNPGVPKHVNRLTLKDPKRIVHEGKISAWSPFFLFHFL